MKPETKLTAEDLQSLREKFPVRQPGDENLAYHELPSNKRVMAQVAAQLVFAEDGVSRDELTDQVAQALTNGIRWGDWTWKEASGAWLDLIKSINTLPGTPLE